MTHMELSQIFQGQEVTLAQVLQAREERVLRQREFLGHGGQSLVCFTMNIAGPIKDFPLAQRAQQGGVGLFKQYLQTLGIRILLEREADALAGKEKYLLLDASAERVKHAAVLIENEHPLGRLFDIDVLDSDGKSIPRQQVSASPRRCLLCDKPAKICARSRTHPVTALQQEIGRLLRDYFTAQLAEQVAQCAVRATLYEVLTTPKPGLIDRANSGAHQDMDIFTFADSSSSLFPWFCAFAQVGAENPQISPSELFPKIRILGIQAENAMFSATKGVNTHKGLIFSLGLICSGAGYLYGRGEAFHLERLLALCGEIAVASLEDFSKADPVARTHGEQAYFSYQVTGARGEAAQGFPSVRLQGLPVLRAQLAGGHDINYASAVSLIALMSSVSDTNLISRSNQQRQEQIQAESQALLETLDEKDALSAIWRMDQSFIRENLSPGGCADLLAITLMLEFLSQTLTDDWTAPKER